METSGCDDVGTISGQTRCNIVLAALMSQYPNWKTHGFGAAVRSLFPNDEELHEYLSKVRPDAYAIHAEDREIDIIEIIDTHPINVDKAGCIGAIADLLDDAGWTVGVVCFDAAGNLMSHIPGVYYSRWYVNRGSFYNASPSAVAVSNAPEMSAEEREHWHKVILSLPALD